MRPPFTSFFAQPQEAPAGKGRAEPQRLGKAGRPRSKKEHYPSGVVRRALVGGRPELRTKEDVHDSRVPSPCARVVNNLPVSLGGASRDSPLDFASIVDKRWGNLSTNGLEAGEVGGGETERHNARRKCV